MDIKMKNLRPSLQNVINEWLTQQWTPYKKSLISVEPSPHCKDKKEFMITFEIRLEGDYAPKFNHLFINKPFFTFTQDNGALNPDGDVYQLVLFLQKLDSEFQPMFKSRIF